MSGVLTPAEIELLAAVQDRLIPPEGARPGAGESGAAKIVDGYLARWPALRAPVLRALRAVEAAAPDGFARRDPPAAEAALRAVEAAHPAEFAALVRHTYIAYYTNQAVQTAIGYAAEPPQPRGYPLTPLDPKLLDGVRARGKLWRDA